MGNNTHPSWTFAHRLPGARLSLRVPPVAHTYTTRPLTHRPSSASMVEVPVKLDASWSPIGFNAPETVALRVMSDPGVVDHEQFRHFEFVHEDPHPGTKLSPV